MMSGETEVFFKDNCMSSRTKRRETLNYSNTNEFSVIVNYVRVFPNVAEAGFIEENISMVSFYLYLRVCN